MYCPKCGKENPDNAQLCRWCSWVLTGISTITPVPDARTSKLAVASLVLAVLSFFTLFITAIPAFILGLVSIFKIEKSAGRLNGRGLAIAGVAVPALSLPVVALLAGILMPALARVKAMAQRAACGTNMRCLGNAMILYADDNNGKYPDTSKWCDLLIEHTGVSEEQFRCISAPEGPCNYAMNKAIEKLGPDAPADMVLLFETSAGWNQAGGREILTADNHRGDGCNVLFNDLHVQFVKMADINDLKWSP